MRNELNEKYKQTQFALKLASAGKKLQHFTCCEGKS